MNRPNANRLSTAIITGCKLAASKIRKDVDSRGRSLQFNTNIQKLAMEEAWASIILDTIMDSIKEDLKQNDPS